LYDCTNVFRCA